MSISPSNVNTFLKTMVVEGKLSFEYGFSRPQKQRGKSPPRTDDFFDEHFGARTSTKVRKRNTFHSSGQISNNLDWEKDELKVSNRYAVAFSAPFFINHSSNCWRGVLPNVVLCKLYSTLIVSKNRKTRHDLTGQHKTPNLSQKQ